MVHIDHVVEVKDGGAFWDPDNLRVVCRYHHYSKTVEKIGERQSGRVGSSSGYPTPGDPRYCWYENADGWHFFNPMHAEPDHYGCDWPDCENRKRMKAAAK